MPSTGTSATVLVVLRGNSASGKSTTAKALRERLGRGVAWVEQDYVRRILLWEKDRPDAVNVGLISHTVRYALDHGYHVLLEGILDSGRYGEMLEALRRDHVGRTMCYYFDLSFEETVRRHATRPLAAEVRPEEMREWYRARDLLGFESEQLISQGATLEQNVDRVLEAFGARELEPH